MRNHAKGQHVGAALYLFGDVFHGKFDDLRTAGGDNFRHVALRRVGKDEGIGRQWQFDCEPVRVVPINGDKDVKALARRADWFIRQVDHGRSLATPDLRTGRTHKQAVKTRFGRSFQQHITGGDHTRTTGTRERN